MTVGLIFLTVAILAIVVVRWLIIRSHKGFRTYVIPVGKHYSYDTADPLGLPWKLSVTRRTRMHYTVMFGVTANYDLESVDQLDVNKLCGLSFHVNDQWCSARFGWRWDATLERVVLSAFVQDRRVRGYVIHELGTVCLGEQFNLNLVRVGQTVTFQLQRHVGDQIVTSTWAYVLVTRPWPIAFRQYPYFGGNRTAPRRIKLWLMEQ